MSIIYDSNYIYIVNRKTLTATGNKHLYILQIHRSNMGCYVNITKCYVNYRIKQYMFHRNSQYGWRTFYLVTTHFASFSSS